MNSSVCKLRFAPSPTGFLHLGSLRTALFNFLLARQRQGKLILRIEDTDKSRTIPGAAESIVDDLKWCGIEFDEGPHINAENGDFQSSLFIQSNRKCIYKGYAEQLLEEKKAYKCFCSKTRLESLRNSLGHAAYDGKCRGLHEGLLEDHFSERPHTVRLAVDRLLKTSYHDTVYGSFCIANAALNDIVLMRADGTPTYHFASVVDDHLMGISNVLRGQEWLSFMPYHVLLYEAFGWKAPIFSHLPLISGQDGRKLSKRSLEQSNLIRDLKAKGFLPESLVNFVALLGWNPSLRGSKEIFTMQELIDGFSLFRLNQAPALADLGRLQWFNKQHYKNALGSDPLLDKYFEAVQKHYSLLDDVLPETHSKKHVSEVIKIMDARTSTVETFLQCTRYFFQQNLAYSSTEWNGLAFAAAASEAPEKRAGGAFSDFFASLKTALSSADFAWDADAVRHAINASVAHTTLAFKDAAMALRFCLSAHSMGPPLVSLMVLLGKTLVLARISRFEAFLKAHRDNFPLAPAPNTSSCSVAV